jgi:hypothetical protein
MPAFRYHLSNQPSGRLPGTTELATIEADSATDVARKLLSTGSVPPGSDLSWVHVLVWNSKDGKSRGFESISFAEVSDTPCGTGSASS